MGPELRDYEAALMVDKHPRTIQRWCQAGKLPGAYKAGRSWRIPRSALGGLSVRREAEPLERYVNAATTACRVLDAELRSLEEEGRPPFPRNWQRLAGALRALQGSLDGLPERVNRAAIRRRS